MTTTNWLLQDRRPRHRVERLRRALILVLSLLPKWTAMPKVEVPSQRMTTFNCRTRSLTLPQRRRHEDTDHFPRGWRTSI